MKNGLRFLLGAALLAVLSGCSTNPTAPKALKSNDVVGTEPVRDSANARMASALATVTNWVPASASAVPTKYVGQIVAFYADGSMTLGSGCLVGPSHVLTAGHCMIKAEKKWAGRPQSEWKPVAIMFTPGLQGTWAPYGSANAAAWAVSQPFLDGSTRSRDYGIIKLNRNLGSRTGGWAPIAEWKNDATYGVTIYGYPGSNGVSWPTKLSDSAFNESSFWWTDPDGVFRDWHAFFTTNGHPGNGGASGGPVMVNQTVYGVFTGTMGTRLRGMRLSTQVKDEIRNWIASHP